MCVGRIRRNLTTGKADQALPPCGERAIVRFMETPDNATEPTGIAAQDWATASADPQYRAAVVDLLGALANGLEQRAGC